MVVSTSRGGLKRGLVATGRGFRAAGKRIRVSATYFTRNSRIARYEQKTRELNEESIRLAKKAQDFSKKEGDLYGTWQRLPNLNYPGLVAAKKKAWEELLSFRKEKEKERLYFVRESARLAKESKKASAKAARLRNTK